MLYQAANKLIKTLYVARTGMAKGNDNAALLSYHEIAYLFLDHHTLKKEKSCWEKFGRKINEQESNIPINKNLGICYNNIACIHAKKREFDKQN